VLDKEQVLGLIRSGRIYHSSYEQRIEQAKRYGDVVIVMGSETVVDAPGSRALERRYTNVWHNEQGVWRLIGRHANVIQDAPGQECLSEGTGVTGNDP
jgi:Domain of unknown function (DUF4440)